MQPHATRDRLLLLSGFIALLAIWITSLFGLETTAQRVWASLILFLIGVLFGTNKSKGPGPRSLYLRIAVETVLASLLFLIRPGWSWFPIVFFILSPQVMIDFPIKIGILWLGLFTLVTGIGLVASEGLTGLVMLLPYTAGFAFFGLFGWVMFQADRERERSVQLLNELQETHAKLKHYSERLEELTISEERNRIAREMHDTLGHRLTIASVQLEGAQRLISSNPQKVDQILGTVREQVRESLSDLRRTVAMLRAPVDEDLPLAQAITNLANQVREATGLTLHVSIGENIPPVPAAQKQALFRAAQEGLTNIQRHAKASEAWIYLYYQDGQVALLIGDNGSGVSAEYPRTGFGLHGLQERAALLEGEFHLDPRPGGGTLLTFRLPLMDGYKP